MKKRIIAAVAIVLGSISGINAIENANKINEIISVFDLHVLQHPV